MHSDADQLDNDKLYGRVNRYENPMPHDACENVTTHFGHVWSSLPSTTH